MDNPGWAVAAYRSQQTYIIPTDEEHIFNVPVNKSISH
jgi:hypothetical protein